MNERLCWAPVGISHVARHDEGWPNDPRHWAWLSL